MSAAKTLKVEVNGETRELKMPYGMLTELLRITGCDDAEATTMLITDLTTRDVVIRRLLTPDLNKPMDDYAQLVSSFDLDIEADAVDKIVGWVLEHFLDFFVRGIKVLSATQAAMAPEAKTA